MKNTKLRVNYLMSAQIIRSLWDGPATAQELTEHSGATYRTVLLYLKALKWAKLIRMHGKAKDKRGSKTLPIWEWAPDEKDIKQKVAKPAERSRLHRQRKKANEVHRRLTLLGSGAREHETEEGGGSPSALDGRPHPSEQQVVQRPTGT